MRRRRSPSRAESRPAKKPAASRAKTAARPERPAIPGPEARLSFTASQIPTVMWSVDQDLRITSGMGSGADAMGLRQNEYVGKTLFDVFETTDTSLPPIRTHLRALEGESGSYEVVYRGRTLSAHVQPIRGETGEITGAMGVGLDITERRHAEEALRTSEEHYRDLFASAPIGIFRSTRDGRLLMANQELARILDYASAEELQALNLGRDVYRREEDRRTLVAQHAERTTPWTVDIEWKRRDGTPIWVRLTARAVQDQNGQFQHFEAFVRDVTERRRADEELANREAMLRTVFDSEPECVKVLAKDGTLVTMNPAGLAMIEAESLDQVRGQSVLALVLPPFRSAFAALTTRVLRGETGSLEFEIEGLKGARRWLETHAAPLRAADGRITAVLGVTRDITERKRTEQELAQAEAARRASEEQYRVIAETATDVIVTIDEASRIQFVNPAAQAVLGYRPAELIGESLTILMPESLRKRHTTALDRYVITGMQGMRWSGVELVARRKDGSEFPAEISFGETFRDGRRLFTGFIRDITSRKRAEDSLRDSRQRLRGLTGRLEQVREEERAHIAREIHDQLGQSLTAIKLDLASLSEHLPEGDAWRRARETLALLDDTIKAVRRISAELRPVVLDELGLAAAVEWYAQDFGQRTGLTIRVHADALDGELHRDNATGLFRILQEALTNVARHAAARTVQIALRRRGSTLSLDVADDGAGITPDQASAPTSLGILGMRERAILLGGTMEIIGEPNGGTRVTVWVPVK
jgi:PAS domain S-box-containing protein